MDWSHPETSDAREPRRLPLENATLAAAFDLSPLVLTITDAASGRLIEVNAAFCAMSGIPRDGAIGKTPVELGLWMDPAERERGLADLRAGRPLRDRAATFLTAGGVRDCQISASMITIDGRPCVLSAVKDVTDLKRATDLLLRYRLLAEHTRDILLFMQTDGTIVEGNAAASAAYGYPIDELVGKSIADLRAPQTMSELSEQFLTALATGIRFETVHLRRDGSTFPVEVASQSAHAGDELLVLSVIRDISERRRAEEGLRASEARFRALAEAMPQLVWTSDADGRIEYLNRLWETYTGRPHEELLRDGWTALVHSDDLPAAEAAWAAIHSANANDLDIELRMRRHDGAMRWFTCRAHAAIDPETGRKTWYGSCTDIDELKQAEARRGAIIDGLAHDLKNPLAAIKAQAQMLKRRLERDPAFEVTTQLGQLAGTATRMSGLIDEMLDATHLAAGSEIELNRSPVDLVELTRNAAATYDRMSSKHELVVDGNVEHLVGAWDAARLERVLGNLIANAIKYSPDGGRIEIGVDERRDGRRRWMALSVRDQGIGIPEADLPLVFQRRHRGANVGRIGGTGLGLAGVADIVRLHGGTISVESTVGSGSTFTILLPVV